MLSTVAAVCSTVCSMQVVLCIQQCNQEHCIISSNVFNEKPISNTVVLDGSVQGHVMGISPVSCSSSMRSYCCSSFGWQAQLWSVCDDELWHAGGRTTSAMGTHLVLETICLCMRVCLCLYGNALQDVGLMWSDVLSGGCVVGQCFVHDSQLMTRQAAAGGS